LRKINRVNIKTAALIREACVYARDTLRLRLLSGGPWYEWDSEKIIGTDPIGAVILKCRALPSGLDPKRPETFANPGFIAAARTLLGVDHFWLYRFWMGFDRGFQILVYSDDDKTPSRDDISEFGIALYRELFRSGEGRDVRPPSHAAPLNPAE
jgi:hypothetical protein